MSVALTIPDSWRSLPPSSADGLSCHSLFIFISAPSASIHISSLRPSHTLRPSGYFARLRIPLLAGESISEKELAAVSKAALEHTVALL
jgi:hypothetical protein